MVNYRPGGDYVPPGMVRGGVPPMRPDQANQPTSRAGSGPAPQPSTITARRVIIAGPGNLVLAYTPTVAAGNLVASISATSTTDSAGNTVFAGVTAYGPGGLGVVAMSLVGGALIGRTAVTEAGPWTLLGSLATSSAAGFGWSMSTGLIATALELLNLGSTPAAPATGGALFGAGTTLKVSSSDGNVYAIERLTLVGTTASQLISSTGFTTIAGMSCNLSIGTYRVRGQVVLEGVAAAAGNPEFQLNGTATVSGMAVQGLFHPNTGASIAVNGANATAFGVSMVGQVLATTAQQVFEFDGIITTSGAGTLHLDAACSVAVDTYDVFGTVSYMEVLPVSA